jgi:hypothetical protein
MRLLHRLGDDRAWYSEILAAKLDRIFAPDRFECGEKLISARAARLLIGAGCFKLVRRPA